MSAKERKAIPKAIRDKVLADYRHRCAICASDSPHLHHIDEDPANNDELNLLPLCPNCHLTDLHDPTRPMGPKRLRLFREYRDPLILRSEFLPLFRRVEFLYGIEVNQQSTDRLEESRKELVDFVRALKMGAFYADRIDRLTKPPGRVYAIRIASGPDPEYERQRAIENREDRERLHNAAAEVTALVVELLRYQDWHHEAEPKSV